MILRKGLAIPATVLLFACSLLAQDAKINPDKPVENVVVKNPELDAAKARIVLLEQKLALTEAKLTALAQFYAATEQLQGLAAKEPRPEEQRAKPPEAAPVKPEPTTP